MRCFLQIIKRPEFFSCETGLIYEHYRSPFLSGKWKMLSCTPETCTFLSSVQRNTNNWSSCIETRIMKASSPRSSVYSRSWSDKMVRNKLRYSSGSHSSGWKSKKAVTRRNCNSLLIWNRSLRHRIAWSKLIPQSLDHTVRHFEISSSISVWQSHFRPSDCLIK